MDAALQGGFPTTQWSLVLGRTSADQEFAGLCAIYRPPLLRFLLVSGVPEAEAEDLLQGFFASLLDGNALRPRGPAAGRFRSYLLGALKHHSANQRRRQRALKRGGGAEMVSWVDTVVGTRAGCPEHAYERAWALTVLREGIERLEAEYRARGRGPVFDALRPHLDGSGGDVDRELGAQLGLRPGAVRVALHRLRRRYAVLIRQVIGETVEDPAEVEAEVAHLARALRDG